MTRFETYSDALAHAEAVLVKLGAEVVHRSPSGSVYFRWSEREDAEGYIYEPYTLRVSDHYVPETPEREHDRGVGHGQQWDLDWVICGASLRREQFEKELRHHLPEDIKDHA